MNWNTWQGQLAGARSVEDVLRVVRDYLSLLHYFEVHTLPPIYRPREKYLTSREVAEYAYDLAAREAGGDDPRSALLERLSAFFSLASQRCAQLEAMAAIPVRPVLASSSTA